MSTNIIAAHVAVLAFKKVLYLEILATQSSECKFVLLMNIMICYKYIHLIAGILGNSGHNH